VALHDRPKPGAVAFSIQTEGEAMTQSELNRAVAKATGESITTIARMGFEPLAVLECDPESQTIDWDEIDALHRVSWQRRRKPRPSIA
jgi:hypothetical protein